MNSRVSAIMPFQANDATVLASLAPGCIPCDLHRRPHAGRLPRRRCLVLRHRLPPSEAVSLRLADYGTAAIIVLGKGSRERTVFTAGARRAVAAGVRGPAPGPVLRPVGKAGRAP